MILSMTHTHKQNHTAGRDRRLTIIVFSLFFSWLLAVPFEGQVLYVITDYHGITAHSFVFGAMAVHIAGLLACTIFVRNMRTAKKLILFSIAFCAVATGVLFFPPSYLWTAALLMASFFVGTCVAAWGFYFKEYSPKDKRIKTMADGLIFSNLLMILINVAAIHISPQIGLGFSIAVLAAAFLFALRLPQKDMPQEPTKRSGAKPDADKFNKLGALAFLCLFIVVITITSGLMYQVVNPAFAHLEWLTSWYWAVPYIAALFIMRNLSGKVNRAYILYVAIAMIGVSYILFVILGRSWAHYLVVNTLLLGACGIYDLFWWSILGDMLEYGKNPVIILGVGLSANVFGVLVGGIIGTAITTEQNYILLVFGVICAAFIMLPPLNKRLIKLLKNSVYLPAPAEPTVQEQVHIIKELVLTEPLTARESEVMNLLMTGKTYKAIADELYISENTVGSHARSVYTKAGAANRTELMNLLLKTPNSPSEQ